MRWLMGGVYSVGSLNIPRGGIYHLGYRFVEEVVEVLGGY